MTYGPEELARVKALAQDAIDRVQRADSLLQSEGGALVLNLEAQRLMDEQHQAMQSLDTFARNIEAINQEFGGKFRMLTAESFDKLSSFDVASDPSRFESALTDIRGDRREDRASARQSMTGAA